MRFKLRTHPDVLIAGGGNAALCAALAAAEDGARVLVLEAAPRLEPMNQQTHRQALPKGYML